jgi:hypothetical protein
METFYTGIMVLGVFLLRLGIPLTITLGVAYGLRRLDAHWEAEAQVRQAVASREIALNPAEQPCWVLKKCPESLYTQCPAYHHADQPCWMVFNQLMGVTPGRCLKCTLFARRNPVHQLAT